MTPASETPSPVVTTRAVDDGIVVITMDRPGRLNALSMELVEQLHAAVAAVDADPSVRVVILTGAGRGFCAGADIKGGQDPGDPGEPIAPGPIAQRLQVQEFLASLHERVHRSRKPFIAAVNGVAVGGGFSLALACDVRIASEAASFGAVFIRLGISACDMGTSYFLPRLVGASRSAELLLTGEGLRRRRGPRHGPGHRRRCARRSAGAGPSRPPAPSAPTHPWAYG